MSKLLENEELQRMVDYSFGDQSGVLGGVPNAYMYKANNTNGDFRKKVLQLLSTDKKVMTLFIDNIRLYRRPIEYSDWQHLKPISAQDRIWLNQFEDENLLLLCAETPEMKFVIFTAFEDTPLDEYIEIPPNVLSINAANAVYFGGKIRPFPHGIERKMYEGYNHHELLEQALNDDVVPTEPLLACYREDTGTRKSIKNSLKDIATFTGHLEYEDYLKAIQDHRFVLCPSGNGIESARNWETLYLKRVPIFKDHPYLREMFKDFPALFVEDFDKITKELLDDNSHLYEEAQNINPLLLDLDTWYTTALPSSMN